MQELLPFVLIMVASGYLLRKTGLLRADAARDLNQIVFYLTLPPLIFLALHRAAPSWSLLVLPAVAWGMSIFGIGLGILIGKGLGLSRPKIGAVALTLSFGNTTFFGYPIVRSFYGAEHLTYAIFYDLLGATLAVNTLGVALAAAMGGGAIQFRSILRRLLLFPPIWALALGLTLHGLELPERVVPLLQRLSDLTVPLIMLSIGLSLQFRHWRQDLPLVGLVAFGKLLVLPLATWGVTGLLGLPLAWQQAAVLQAAMPVMFYVLTLTLVFGLQTSLVVNAIMVTTLLSFLTLPLWYQVLSPGLRA